MTRRMLIAGNWKMNGLKADLAFFEEIDKAAKALPDIEVFVAPPATLISSASLLCSVVRIAGQDCHVGRRGAHTGDISAEMLADAGATYVILGHSERRVEYGESNELIKAKADIALQSGLVPVVCVGETLQQRENGHAIEVVCNQVVESLPSLANYVIAYEPVWAIGSGLTPSLEDISEMHAAIRACVARGQETQILYGGSVKPGNAREIFNLTDVDGALVGGASLKADDFIAIIHSAV